MPRIKTERSHAAPQADNPALGILLMCAAAGLWVLHDAISKWLTESYSIFQVLFMRSLFAFLPLTVFLQREQGFAGLVTPRLWAIIGRGCLGLASFGLFLAALPRMPLADVFAIVMSAPLVIAALSMPLLGERVGARRWMAVLIGFGAVLFMVRPAGGLEPIGALLVLGSVIFYALAMIATRVIGRAESASTMSFYTSAVFLAFGAATTPFVWRDPSAFDLLLMVGTGLLAGSAQYCMTQAFRIAPVAVVAPYEYTSMVWALLLGFLIWGDVPGTAVIGGALVIVASGLYVLHRERQVRRALRRAAADSSGQGE